jgi:hypothetical protein
MKRITAVIILIIIPLAWAAPISFTITFTVPSAKVAQMKEGYLECCPVPVGHSDPNDPNSPIVPKMTEKQWILGNARKAAMQHIFDKYRKGKEIIDQRNRIKQEDMFE